MQASCGEAKEFSLYRNVKNMRENEMNAARSVRNNYYLYPYLST